MPRSPSLQRGQPFDIGILDRLLGFHLRLAQLTMLEEFARDSPVPGITAGQLVILIFIDRNPQLTQQMLCDRLRVQKSTLAVTLHRLTQRRLIRRERSTVDRRANWLRLTAKGSAVLSAMLRYTEQHERALSRKLTESERKTLIRLLGKLAIPARSTAKARSAGQRAQETGAYAS